MSSSWLPMADGIVPPIEQAGPVQEEERFATRNRALEDARSEYRARRYDVAEAMLDQLILALRAFDTDPPPPRSENYVLLLASAFVLRARLHWRRAEHEREVKNEAKEREERKLQESTFEQAVQLFKRHNSALTDHPTESRLRTDFGIALYRTGNVAMAVDALKAALGTGAAPVEAFAYLGMSYSDLGDYPEVTRALRKGLQLAPRDKNLLETLAITHERAREAALTVQNYSKAAEDAELAVQKYCQAAIEAGEERGTERCTQIPLRRGSPPWAGRPSPAGHVVFDAAFAGKLGEARAVLDDTLQQFPDHPWALGLRGMLSADEGKTDEALRDFEAARADKSELAWVRLEQAKALAARDGKGARHQLARAAKLLERDDPRLVQARNEVEVRNAVATAGRTAAHLAQRFVSWLASTEAADTISEKFGGYVEQALRSPRGDRLKFLEQLAKRLPDRVRTARSTGARVLGAR